MLILLLLCPVVLAGRMEVLYSWKTLDFTFPSEALREVYLANGDFIPNNNILLDVDIWRGLNGEDRKVFVTLPKMKKGIPATLATVTNLRRNNTTLLKPYPDWSWHQGNCDGITSVFRIRVDQCGRLWVLDTGVIEVFTTYQRICPPQILVFDIDTEKLIKRYLIPESQLDHDSLLITIVVDVRTPDCRDNAFAYLADVNAYKLIVYDSVNDKSWRVSSSYFYPYPLNGNFHIAGKFFNLMDGLFGLALGPLRTNGDRTLYYHSLASVRESWVSTSVIRNSSLFSEDPAAVPKSFHVFEGTRSSQSAAEDMTDDGILLFSLVGDNAIGCWSTYLPFKRQNLDIIAKDDVSLQFQSGMKVHGNNLWTVSSRFQNYILGQIPTNEVNYRINVGKISDLVRNTRCDVHRSGGSSSGLAISFKNP